MSTGHEALWVRTEGRGRAQDQQSSIKSAGCPFCSQQVPWFQIRTLGWGARIPVLVQVPLMSCSEVDLSKIQTWSGCSLPFSDCLSLLWPGWSLNSGQPCLFWSHVGLNVTSSRAPSLTAQSLPVTLTCFTFLEPNTCWYSLVYVTISSHEKVRVGRACLLFHHGVQNTERTQ